MSITQSAPTPPRPGDRPALERLAPHQKKVVYAEFGLAAVLALVAARVLWRYPFATTWPVAVWAIAAAVAAATVGLLRFRSAGGGELAPAEQLRLRLLTF